MLNKILFSFLLFTSCVLSQDEGLKHYQNQEFEAAQKYYESVLREKGNQSQAQFGLGSSAFQRGDLEMAKQAFEQSLKTNDNKLKSKAMYNLGNTFYKNEKKDEALAFYRKALELDPTDKEAKFNYEFLKYQEKPPEDQDKKDQDKSDEDKDQEQKDQEGQKKEEKNKDQEQKDQEKKQEDQEDKDETEQDKKEQKEQKEKESQGQEKQQQVENDSQEEKSQDLKQAESILDALKQDEKIMQKRQILRTKSRKLAKDW